MRSPSIQSFLRSGNASVDARHSDREIRPERQGDLHRRPCLLVPTEVRIARREEEMAVHKAFSRSIDRWAHSAASSNRPAEKCADGDMFETIVVVRGAGAKL